MNTKPKIHPYKQVRKSGVPISFFVTPDPQATIVDCSSALNGKAEKLTLVQWDIACGITGVNALGKDYAKQIPPEDAPRLRNLSEALAFVCNNPLLGADLETEQDRRLGQPNGGCLFVHNAHRYMQDISCIQAIWNTRDIFKGCCISLVLLGCHATIAPELKNDIPIFDEQPPTPDDILTVLDSSLEDAPAMEAVDRNRVVDGCVGYLSKFNVEQSIALSRTTQGVNYDALWELKVSALRNLAGLEITLPKLTFADLRGSEGIKRIMRMV